MIYRFVKWLVWLSVTSYFRRILIKGAKHLDTKGPIIFVANHPSAFMDPLVVAITVRRPIHYLAAAEFFGKGLKAWLYKRHFNMIPIYRPSTMPGEVHKNVDAFSECYNRFERGGAVLVFPEGNSVTEIRIRKLKTGVARMALSALEREKVKEVLIIPIGLNYSNPHRFRSELFVNVGEPISTAAFSANPAGVQELTQLVEDRMKDTSLHVDSPALDSLIRKVILLEINNLRTNPEIRIDAAFSSWQVLVKGLVKWHMKNESSLLIFEEKLDTYLRTIKELNISDTYVAMLRKRFPLTEFIKLLISIPLVVPGFLLTAGPYYLTVFVFRKLDLFDRKGDPTNESKVSPAFKGSVAMAIGMVIFLVYFLIMGGVITFISSSWVGIGLVVFSFLSGLLTLHFVSWRYSFIQKLRIRRLEKQQVEKYKLLIELRGDLMKTIRSLNDGTHSEAGG